MANAQDNTGFLKNVEVDYPDYLRDESRRIGKADSISFPKTEADLVAQLGRARQLKLPVTIQGARTGITAGAVPDGGHIINLSRMNRIMGFRKDKASDAVFVKVEPGVLLSELAKEIAAGQKGFFLPPDPTETSASIGGMVACNASGARSFFYGPTRKYVERLRLVLADGATVDLRRGEQRADGRKFSISAGGRAVQGNIPSYKMPEVKNASGYFVGDNMDLLDLFIGSEGTLAIFSEIELRLIRQPEVMWGIVVFFPSEEAAVRFVLTVRTDPVLAAVEFFDCHALDLLRRQKKINPAFGEIRDMPANWHTAVYVEYHGSAAGVEKAVMNSADKMVQCGGDPDATWLASDSREVEQLKKFRHAVPEAVNLWIDERKKKEPSLTKLGTDLAVPDRALERVMAMYHDGLGKAGLEYVMFGHIGNNHVHVNIIPNNAAEYEHGKKLYLEWARAVVDMGGTVSAEHGIGKLKTAMLKEMYGEEGIRQMRTLKDLFDPEGLLNRGNLFELVDSPVH